MTMHLLRGISSLNTRKRKVTATKAQLQQWEIDWRAECKQLKRQGLATRTLEQYNNYRLGKAEKQKQTFQPLTSPIYKHGSLDDHRTKYPSQEMSGGPTEKKESPVYSGERKLLGIATLHKSNMVPVFDQESAIDIARMRRN
jgi:hypothetical protein